MIKKLIIAVFILTMIGFYFEFYHNAKVDDIDYKYMMR